LAPPDLLHDLRKDGGEAKHVGQTQVATANGISEASEYLIDGLVFEGMPVGRLRAQENPDGLNVVGMGFLSRFDSYALIPAEMIFCYNAKNFTRDDHRPLRQISLIYVDGRVELFKAGKDDVAGYGLKHGDVLLEVNGKKVQPADIEQLREDLRVAPQGELTILIDRSGERKSIKL
jgi:hypothetical protein